MQKNKNSRIIDVEVIFKRAVASNKILVFEIINTTITKLKISNCYTIISSKNETLLNCLINEGFQVNKKYQTLYKNIKLPIKLEKKYYKKDLKIGVPN